MLYIVIQKFYKVNYSYIWYLFCFQATVRLIINYRKSHKAVVRVNPRDSLVALMPAICDKCELDPKTTVLLRDIQSDEPLDLTKTLNDYGIRDLYAKELNGKYLHQSI